MKRVVVIGLGIFGFNLVKSFYESGLDVVAIDKNKEVIQQIKDCCTKAILADGTSREVMESLGIQEDDIGHHLFWRRPRCKHANDASSQRDESQDNHCEGSQ